MNISLVLLNVVIWPLHGMCAHFFFTNSEIKKLVLHWLPLYILTINFLGKLTYSILQWI